MTDQNPTVEEQRKMLEDAGKAGEPEPPDYIVMEDQDPERFKQMMSEGQPEGGGIEMAQGLMQAINGLPGKIVDRIQDE